jgi:hypothetical protein
LTLYTTGVVVGWDTHDVEGAVDSVEWPEWAVTTEWAEMAVHAG